jgi:hypothetical protein
MDERFWRPYMGQAIGGKMDFLVLIGGAEEWAAHRIIFDVLHSSSSKAHNCTFNHILSDL